jgi:protein-S-isoprenylcysteine O-methyltransferase Ste14
MLDNRIPPPLVLVATAGAMWATSHYGPSPSIAAGLRIPVAGIFVLLGLIMLPLGFMAFRRAGTTIDPVHIETASALVTSGIFRLTRNPMYVGMASLLVGLAVYLASPWSALGPVVFVLYITRFQIVPEERAMQSKFGDNYARYRASVRRWI